METETNNEQKLQFNQNDSLGLRKDLVKAAKLVVDTTQSIGKEVVKTAEKIVASNTTQMILSKGTQFITKGIVVSIKEVKKLMDKPFKDTKEFEQLSQNIQSTFSNIEENAKKINLDLDKNQVDAQNIYDLSKNLNSAKEGLNTCANKEIVQVFNEQIQTLQDQINSLKSSNQELQIAITNIEKTVAQCDSILTKLGFKKYHELKNEMSILSQAEQTFIKEFAYLATNLILDIADKKISQKDLENNSNFTTALNILGKAAFNSLGDFIPAGSIFTTLTAEIYKECKNSSQIREKKENKQKLDEIGIETHTPEAQVILNNMFLETALELVKLDLCTIPNHDLYNVEEITIKGGMQTAIDVISYMLKDTRNEHTDPNQYFKKLLFKAKEQDIRINNELSSEEKIQIRKIQSLEEIRIDEETISGIKFIDNIIHKEIKDTKAGIKYGTKSIVLGKAAKSTSNTESVLNEDQVKAILELYIVTYKIKNPDTLKTKLNLQDKKYDTILKELHYYQQKEGETEIDGISDDHNHKNGTNYSQSDQFQNSENIFDANIKLIAEQPPAEHDHPS